ncbi:MAG: fibronectin type III domain-containing protein [Bacteroidales bacterium]|nr:fibronectin type III domain-containing protein [Bacteroidales bacterium]
MKTQHISWFVIIMTTFLLLACCKKEEERINKTNFTTTDNKSLLSEVNDYIELYALGIAISLCDEEFRSIIKEEAQKKFDGDYDILATSLQKRKLENKGVLVGEFLLENLEKNGIKIEDDYLDEVASLIPNLQVSIPIKCDEWDEVNFIPPVVPVPVDFDDINNDFIDGYDRLGNQYTFSLKEDPDIPIIVVSVSERIDENGKFRWEEEEPVTLLSSFDSLSITSRDIPVNPSSLTLHHGAANEIILEWPDVIGENGYKIYRKVDAGDFSLRATVSANNNGYIDKYLSYGKRYWYKIKSYNNDGESAFSPISTTIASARTDGQNLSISRMMFNTTSDLNQVESWIRGVPELRVRVIRGLANSSTAEYVYRSSIISPPSRDAIVGQWWNNLINITNWYTDVLGSILVFDWEEEDNTLLSSITLTAKYENKTTGTFDFGGTLTFNVSNNGPVGFTSVYYWDNPYVTNEYSINGFKWSFKSYIIPIPGKTM